MNSSILVSGFVILGVCGMAYVFGPSFLSDDQNAEVVVASIETDPNHLSPVAASVPDEEPFVWESPSKQDTSQELPVEIASEEDKQSPETAVAVSPSKPTADQWTPAEQDTQETSVAVKEASVEQELNDFFGAPKAKQTQPTEVATLAPTVEAPSAAPIDVVEPPQDVPPKTEPAVKVAEVTPTVDTPATPAVRVAKLEPTIKAPVVEAPAPTTAPAVEVAEVTSPAEATVTTPVRVAKLEPTAQASVTDPLDIVVPPTVTVPAIDTAATVKPTIKQPRSFNADAPETTEPAKVAATEDEDFALLPSEPTEPAPAKASEQTTTVKITNPKETALTVAFLLAGKPVILPPGESHAIDTDETVALKFSRGGDFGIAAQSLQPGDYQFSVTYQEGWKLSE